MHDQKSENRASAKPPAPANSQVVSRTRSRTRPAAERRGSLAGETMVLPEPTAYIGAEKRTTRDTMDWDKLRIFHAVADAGSLTHAGDTLHLSQSAVSRQIRALEESLDTTLFRRHARGLLLTEQGELLFEATRSMTKRLDATAARIRDSEDEVFGELRVTTTTGFGTLWLAPRLPRLFERYPNLKIDLMLEERILDLPMREADVAIRMKEPSQADLIRRRLMEVHIRFYASGAYVARQRAADDRRGARRPPADHPEPRLAAGSRRRGLRAALPRRARIPRWR